MERRRLYVMRHGKSDWGEAGQEDVERDLAKRGRRDSKRVGKALAERGLVPDLIISSPARRARLTAKLLARTSGFGHRIAKDPGLYYGEPDQCLAVLRRLPSKWCSVLIVGHNPSLEDLIKVLTGESITLTTASVAAIDLDIERWADLHPPRDQGVVRFVLRPKDLAEPSAGGAQGRAKP